MSKKMALVPPDLVSEYYQLNKPEIRLEDKIIQVLHQNEMPDDLRGKLLSQLIPKYQKSMQPIPPKTFELPPDLFNEVVPERPVESKDIITPVVAKYVIYAVPNAKKKFIVPILERLKKLGYQFNERNELEINGKPEFRSNAVDLFVHLMRDYRKEEPPPKGFDSFYQGVFDANIPRIWIGNKYVRERLELSVLDPQQTPDRQSADRAPTPDQASTPYQLSPHRQKLKWIPFE